MTVRQTALLKDYLLKDPNKTFRVNDAKFYVDQIIENGLDPRSCTHNRVFHEIRPLIKIAEHVAHPDVRISFTGLNSRFDGIIYLDNENIRQKVELTAAVDGYNDALQMELLDKDGRAPAFQKIEAYGTKRNRKFGPNKTKTIRSDEYDWQTLLPLLESALEAKTQRANLHYIGSWLGIVFDDNLGLSEEREKKKRYDPICRQLLHSDGRREEPFSRIFCVGISGRYLFDSREA